MTTLSLRIPDSTHSRLRIWAEQDKLSINQFISTAVSEKLAALATVEYLDARANRASKTKFLAALAQVPAGEVPLHDQLNR
jgi:predicted transcriptional regulator